jgi:hypothetical protein
MALPPAPFVPAELVGTLSLAVMFVWSGDPADGPAAIAPFREVATPLVDMASLMPYPAIYAFLAEAEKRGLSFHRSRFLDTLDDEAIDAILDAMAAPSSPAAMVQLRVLGGAMARVPADATAFAHRDAAVMALVIRPMTIRPRSRPSGPGPRRFTRRSARTTPGSTRTSSRSRVTSGSGRPIRAARTNGSPTSSAATTRPTCSA